MPATERYAKSSPISTMPRKPESLSLRGNARGVFSAPEILDEWNRNMAKHFARFDAEMIKSKTESVLISSRSVSSAFARFDFRRGDSGLKAQQVADREAFGVPVTQNF